MEYLHVGLRQAPIEFKIIKDELNQGRFFKEENLKEIEDIDSVTVFHQKPLIQEDGILLAKYQFLEDGNYVGIVSADIPNSETPYIAVFPFRVGSKNWGYIPIFIVLIILLQLNFWLMSGNYVRLLKIFKN